MTLKNTQFEPIQESWKISDVIGRYPQLIEELVKLNPTFRLLRNPIARRVQSRLVTVAQAAEIARIEPRLLVSRLNASIGLSALEEAHPPDDGMTNPDDAAPTWMEWAPIAAYIDVRLLQREGKEPFGTIMAAVREATTGEIVQLRSSFEPIPLYDVLGQRGFECWSRRLDVDDWEISFFNTGRVPNKLGSKPPPDHKSMPTTGWESPTASITIDVSQLVPPEPLVRIMAALEELPGGSSLLVRHVRRPIHLYPQLDQSGYRHQTREVGPGHVEILIEKPARAT